VGLKFVIQCDACGTEQAVEIGAGTTTPFSPKQSGEMPATSANGEFSEEEAATGQSLIDELAKAGWRLRLVGGKPVAACCADHFRIAHKRLRGGTP
jgi:hypothetical protein